MDQYQYFVAFNCKKKIPKTLEDQYGTNRRKSLEFCDWWKSIIVAINIDIGGNGLIEWRYKLYAYVIRIYTYSDSL